VTEWLWVYLSITVLWLLLFVGIWVANPDDPPLARSAARCILWSPLWPVVLTAMTVTVMRRIIEDAR
jgi:hypothetical protein